MKEIEQIIKNLVKWYAKIPIEEEILGQLIDLGEFVDFLLGT